MKPTINIDVNPESFPDSGIEAVFPDYLAELKVVTGRDLRPRDFIVDAGMGGSSGTDTELTADVVEELGPEVLEQIQAAGIRKGMVEQRLGQLGKIDKTNNQAVQNREIKQPTNKERVHTRLERRILAYAVRNW